MTSPLSIAILHVDHEANGFKSTHTYKRQYIATISVTTTVDTLKTGVVCLFIKKNLIRVLH